jgi:hypothetical protein
VVIDDRADLRRKSRINVESETNVVTTPVAQSAIPRRKKGNPLTHPVPPPVLALSVHAESSVCVVPNTQRPMATVTAHRTNVTVLFTTLFYHRGGSKSWQSVILDLNLRIGSRA